MRQIISMKDARNVVSGIEEFKFQFNFQKEKSTSVPKSYPPGFISIYFSLGEVQIVAYFILHVLSLKKFAPTTFIP